MLGFPVLHQLLQFTQTHVHRVSDAIQPSHPLSSPSPPAFNLSSIRIFANESAVCIRWPKYWGFSFSISPSNEYSGLISFRIDLMDLLAVQGTLKSLLQHTSSATQCLILCDPKDCSMPGLPVHHQLPKLAQTHVHQVSGAIQPSHPLSSPSPPTFNLSQHQGLFK